LISRAFFLWKLIFMQGVMRLDFCMFLIKESIKVWTPTVMDKRQQKAFLLNNLNFR
jgi:hypothetical protein